MLRASPAYAVARSLELWRQQEEERARKRLQEKERASCEDFSTGFLHVPRFPQHLIIYNNICFLLSLISRRLEQHFSNFHFHPYLKRAKPRNASAPRWTSWSLAGGVPEEREAEDAKLQRTSDGAQRVGATCQEEVQGVATSRGGGFCYSFFLAIYLWWGTKLCCGWGFFLASCMDMAPLNQEDVFSLRAWFCLNSWRCLLLCVEASPWALTSINVGEGQRKRQYWVCLARKNQKESNFLA